MILNTGQRTDIPAYYSEWFFNRVREGFVCVRNPYYPQQVTRYRISPDVVDLIAFCTKNPAPMIPRMNELAAFRQFWFVTITPYGREIEPNVPPVDYVIEAFQALSDIVGPKAIGWRYDPIFLSETYSLAFHKEAFARMAEKLAGYTDQVVISFIDLYEKTKCNFPEAREVGHADHKELAETFVKTASKHGMTLRTCFEGNELAPLGIDTTGCMTKEVLERAIGQELQPQNANYARPGCTCLIGSDIGAYNTCGHLCCYCYANYDPKIVRENYLRHDPNSAFLIGGPMEGDIVKDAKQTSWLTGQLTFDFV